MKIKLALMASAMAAFGTGLVCGSANATSVADIENFIATHQNYQLEDDNRENQNVDVDDDGLLDVGDTLRGIARIPRIIDLDGNDELALDDLSAVFEIEVTAKVLNDDPVTPFPEFDFAFGPNAAFATEFSLPAGAMVAFYLEDGVLTPLNACGTAGPGGTCEGNVIDGTLVLVLGFSGGGESWTAIQAPDDTTVANNFSPSTNLGGFNAHLEVLLSGITGIDVGDPWQLQGSVLGSQGVNTPYDVTTDTDLQPVPEPTTLGLMGFGLLGLVGIARLIRRRAA